MNSINLSSLRDIISFKLRRSDIVIEITEPQQFNQAPKERYIHRICHPCGILFFINAFFYYHIIPAGLNQKLRPAFFAFPVGEGWDGANRNAVIEPVEMSHSFQLSSLNTHKKQFALLVLALATLLFEAIKKLSFTLL
jgi:hypothetical protein